MSSAWTTAEQGIAALEKWFNKIGTPTRLSQLGITEADLPKTIENVLGNAASGLASPKFTHVMSSLPS